MIRLECNLATYPLGDGLKDKTNLIVSTENINGIPISPISGAQLTLWSPPQIKLDATFQGDFLYLSFGQDKQSMDPVRPHESIPAQHQ